MDFLYRRLNMNKKNILDYTIEQLSQIEELKNEKSYRTKQIYDWLHKRNVSTFDDMNNIPKNIRDNLANSYFIGGLNMDLRRVSSIDGTEKFLFSLFDNHQIESVLMKYKHGNTVCISTQVGCRMGCTFCASTIDGLARNLTPGEMLAQIYNIQTITSQKVSNVVLMGQGEPLDNYDNVKQFIHILNSKDGINISIRNITISTCGLVPKIIALADDKITATLAISLHAPNDELRKQTMPIANKYSISEIIDAVNYYIEKTNRRVSFEYALISGINDDEATANELCRLLKNKLCHINLIPVNTVVENNYLRPDKKSINKFYNIVQKNNISVTIRREMGSDISGACGQLRRGYKKGCYEDSRKD